MRKLLLSMVALVAVALGAKAAEPTYTAVGTATNDSTWDASSYTCFVNGLSDVTVEVYDNDSIVFRSWAGVDGYDLVAVLGANDSISSFHTLVNGKVYASTADDWSLVYSGAYPDKGWWVFNMSVYSKTYAQLSKDDTSKSGTMTVYCYGYYDSACKKYAVGYYNISWSAAPTSSRNKMSVTRATEYEPFRYTAIGTISFLDSAIEGERLDTLSSVVPVDSALIGLTREITVVGDELGCDSVFVPDWWNYGVNENKYEHTWDFGLYTYEHSDAIPGFFAESTTIGQITEFFYNYGSDQGWISYNWPYTGSLSNDSLRYGPYTWSNIYNEYCHYDHDAETKTGRFFLWGTLWGKGKSGYYYMTWKPEVRVREVTITIGNEGVRTYSSGESLDFSAVSDYVKAYYAPTDTTGTITFKEVVGGVPAYTGLMLKSVSGGAVTVNVPVTDETVAIDDNMLVPILQRKTLPYSTTGYYKYILNDESTGFYKHVENTVSEDHRAYVLSAYDLVTKNEDSVIPFLFEDKDPSAIKSVKAESAKSIDNAYYTLSGIKTSKPTAKGVYIKNGKKIIVR